LPSSQARSRGTTAGGTGRLPRPSTPKRFIAELHTPDNGLRDPPGRDHRSDLVIAGGIKVVRHRCRNLAAGIRARFVVDPDCGHAVRAESRGYDDLVEAFLAEGD
jgi:hypothetical protein